jgi:CubicO group peptidase (beta-lactamase class C family)
LKTFSYIVSFLAFVSSGSISHSQTASDAKATIETIAQAYLSNPQTASVIIGVFREGGAGPEIYSYGTINKDVIRKPDGATLYKLGSIGKTFTATALAYYVVNKSHEVNLNDPINKFFSGVQKLPFWRPVGEPKDQTPITLLNLATHHSSLPDSPPNRKAPPDYTIPLLLEFLGSDSPKDHVRPLPEKPGTKWIYSNTGFGLLGVIMERISAKRYERLLVTLFCDELKMPDTRVDLTDEQKNRLATGYVEGKAEPPAAPISPAFYGAGGNYSTMDDMLKYLAWNMGLIQSTLNNLLPTLHQEREHTGRKDAWVGLAWQMNFLRDGRPKKYIWKDGETGGYTSFICFVPETKTGVVVLSNASGKGLGCDKVGIEVLRLLNPEQ